MTRAVQVASLWIAVLSLPASVSAQQRPAIADQVAKTYGLESWSQVDAIRYTFNIDAGPRKLSRSWVWETKTNQVSYEGKDKDGKPVKVTYSRSDLASQSADVKAQIDPGFMNDQYWLLFPFHLVWDGAVAVEDGGTQKLPIGKGSATKVQAKYPSDVGYTPGDTWDLYVDKDHRVRQMVYHRGGPVKPSLVTVTWADYKKAGPLLFSLDHRGTADGNPVRVFFSNVAVRLQGSSTWTEAK